MIIFFPSIFLQVFVEMNLRAKLENKILSQVKTEESILFK